MRWLDPPTLRAKGTPGAFSTPNVPFAQRDFTQITSAPFRFDEHRTNRTKGETTVVSDPITGLEMELADMWQRGRAPARTYARAIHPTLDPALYPLLVILNLSEAVRLSALICPLDSVKSHLPRQNNPHAPPCLDEQNPD